MALIASTTLAQQSPAIVENAYWLQPPSPEAVGDFMPSFANTISVNGYVDLTCEVHRIGPPERCHIIRESPAGLGFGEAALKIAQLGIVEPRRVDGKVRPSRISFAVPFNAYPLILDPPRPYTGPLPSEAAITSARDLVRRDLTFIKKMSDADLYGGLAPERIAIVRPWVDELFPVSDERIINDLGLALARVLTLSQLEALLANDHSPLADLGSMPDLMEAATSDLFTLKESLALSELRRRYCAAYQCKGDGSGQPR